MHEHTLLESKKVTTVDQLQVATATSSNSPYGTHWCALVTGRGNHRRQIWRKDGNARNTIASSFEHQTHCYVRAGWDASAQAAGQQKRRRGDAR